MAEGSIRAVQADAAAPPRHLSESPTPLPGATTSGAEPVASVRTAGLLPLPSRPPLGVSGTVQPRVPSPLSWERPRWHLRSPDERGRLTLRAPCSRHRVLSTWLPVPPNTPSTPTGTGRAGSSSAPGTWTTCECAAPGGPVLEDRSAPSSWAPHPGVTGVGVEGAAGRRLCSRPSPLRVSHRGRCRERPRSRPHP